MWGWLERLAGREEPAAVHTEARPAPARAKSAEALYCEVALMRLNGQFADIERIDTRASGIFTIASTVLPITAGFISSDRSAIEACAVAKYALVGGFVAYLLLTAFFIWSFSYSKWDARPELAQWKEVTVGRGEEEMQRWLGDACVAAYANNEPFIERKASKTGWALWCLAGEAGCLSVAVLAPLW